MIDYTLDSGSAVLNHGTADVNLLHDLSERPTPMDIESLVVSGDLFAVLATELDSIAVELDESPSNDVSAKLDRLTEILLYLQLYYKVIKRPDHRR